MYRLVILFTVTATCALIASCASNQPKPSVSLSLVPATGNTIVIQNVSVFDSEALTVSPNMDVLIQRDRIVAVLPTGDLQSTAGTKVISGEGATLVPGLIDMHGHVSASTGPSWEFGAPDPEAILRSYVYSGVTTVFDPADASDEAFGRRGQVARGEIIGPRIYTTGKMLTCSDGHPRSLVSALVPAWIAWYIEPQVATAIDTEDEAISEVDALADAGADAIKIAIDRIPLDSERMTMTVATAVATHARTRGLRTVAHIGTTQDAIDAAEAGVALWVHGVYKERIPEESLAKLASYGIPMVTTSEVFDRYARALEPIVPTKLERETVSKAVLESFYPTPDDFELGALQSWLDLAVDTVDVRTDNVRRVHEAGITVLAGSDVQSGVFPGPSLHRELANLVKAGFTPAEAIRAATLDPARFLADNGELDTGKIAPGLRADLLLVEGDPTQDIGALANIREVVLNGNVVERMPVSNTP